MLLLWGLCGYYAYKSFVTQPPKVSKMGEWEVLDGKVIIDGPKVGMGISEAVAESDRWQAVLAAIEVSGEPLRFVVRTNDNIPSGPIPEGFDYLIGTVTISVEVRHADQVLAQMSGEIDLPGEVRFLPGQDPQEVAHWAAAEPVLEHLGTLLDILAIESMGSCSHLNPDFLGELVRLRQDKRKQVDRALLHVIRLNPGGYVDAVRNCQPKVAKALTKLLFSNLDALTIEAVSLLDNPAPLKSEMVQTQFWLCCRPEVLGASSLQVQQAVATHLRREMMAREIAPIEGPWILRHVLALDPEVRQPLMSTVTQWIPIAAGGSHSEDWKNSTALKMTLEAGPELHPALTQIVLTVDSTTFIPQMREHYGQRCRSQDAELLLRNHLLPAVSESSTETRKNLRAAISMLAQELRLSSRPVSDPLWQQVAAALDATSQSAGDRH